MLTVVNSQIGLSNLRCALCVSSFTGMYEGRPAIGMTRCHGYSTELLRDALEHQFLVGFYLQVCCPFFQRPANQRYLSFQKSVGL